MKKQLPVRSKRRKFYNNVLVTEPHIKSLASLVSLNKYFYEIEHEEFLSTYLRKRRNFLFMKKNTNDSNLVCEFCGKEHLSVGLNDVTNKANRNKNTYNTNLATIDHFFPVNGHNNLFWNTDNWVVACKKCNNKKADKDPFEWMQRTFGKITFTEGIQRIIAQDLHI